MAALRTRSFSSVSRAGRDPLLDTGQQPALVLGLVGNDGQRDADGGVNDGFLRFEAPAAPVKAGFTAARE